VGEPSHYERKEKNPDRNNNFRNLKKGLSRGERTVAEEKRRKVNAEKTPENQVKRSQVEENMSLEFWHRKTGGLGVMGGEERGFSPVHPGRKRGKKEGRKCLS